MFLWVCLVLFLIAVHCGAGAAVDNDNLYALDELDDSDKWEVWSYVLGRQMSDSWTHRHRVDADVGLVCTGVEHGFAVSHPEPLFAEEERKAALKEIEKPNIDAPPEEDQEASDDPKQLEKAPEPVSEETARSASYEYGWLVGDSFSERRRAWLLRTDVLCAGFAGGLAGVPSLLSEEQTNKTVESMRKDYKEWVFKNKVKQSIVKSENFMQTRLEKEQAKDEKAGLGPDSPDRLHVSEDGRVQYRWVARDGRGGGDGVRPTDQDVVTIHVLAWNRIGEKFFNSREQGVPRRYLMSAIMPAWHTVLLEMRVGDRVELCGHPDVCYGEAGFGKAIRPGETALFEIELLDIAKPTEQELVAGRAVQLAPKEPSELDKAVNTGAKILVEPKKSAGDDDADNKNNKIKTEL